MSLYYCTVLIDASVNMTIEADSPEDAAEKAENSEAGNPRLCHQCSSDVELGEPVGVYVFDEAAENQLADTTPSAEEIAALKARVEELTDALQFVERWAVHHGAKACTTAESALGVIQHYPPIAEITASYADGKTPDTFNPFAQIEELELEARMMRERNERLETEVNRLQAALHRATLAAAAPVAVYIEPSEEEVARLIETLKNDGAQHMRLIPFQDVVIGVDPPSKFGSPELQAMILARLADKAKSGGAP